jgi:hypothetical protein
MNCPKCHSEETCLCSVAHERRGAVYGVEGEIERADLAYLAAPPCSGLRAALPPLCVAVGLNVVALVGTWALQSSSHPMGLIGVWFAAEPAALRWTLLAVLTGSLISLLAACRSLPQDRAARSRWSRSWVCRDCAATFTPDQPAA